VSVPRRTWVFAAIMLAATVVFAMLGGWQLQRLAEKDALIATVAERLDDAPQPLPAVADWPTLDPAIVDYVPLTATGRLATGSTVLVFTSLTAARGVHSGPGYWVMTPLALEGGGTVFINRGFIPQEGAEDRAALEPMNPATAPLTLVGIGRRPEAGGSFTPAADPANQIDWIRDPQRLAALANVEGPVAPFYIDLPAGGPGDLPQGGETVVEFPNNHLGYALTWFGFALITPILLFFWVWRQRQSAKP
jgi:surfeit locus 1 family protein